MPLLWSALAWARAGGGEHYRSDSGSGSGSGSGEGGELVFWLLIQLVRLTIRYPIIGIPLWIVLIVVAWIVIDGTRKSTRERNERIERPTRPVAVAALTRNDPAFDVSELAKRVGKLFVEVQEAWFRNDLGPVRRYLSDATYRRFTTLLALMRAEGRRDALADIRINGIELLEASSGETFDTVSFAIDASMRDADVAADWSDEQARREAERAPVGRFTEVWTFLRRRGAKSVSEDVWGQGGCPNCGAPFTGGESNTCEYCGAVVNSGNHDWVLSEITQASAYHSSDRALRILQPLRARDPEAAPEILRDRALLLFWKWIEASSLVQPEKLRKFATNAAYGAMTMGLRDAPKESAPLVRTPAVGGADILQCVVDARGYDRVVVEVKWSAEMGAQGIKPRTHVLVMTRKTGALTNETTGLSTERCGTCNAPLTDSDSTTCDFCGHDLATASTEWQMVDVVDRARWRAPL